MPDIYSDVLADVQSEVISIALEYSGRNVSDVYAYLSTDGALFAEVFYRQDGSITRKSRLEGVDTSVGRQDALLKYILTQLERLIRVAHETDHPVPTESRLSYNVRNGSLNSSFRYDVLNLADSDSSENDIVERWMDQESSEIS